MSDPICEDVRMKNVTTEQMELGLAKQRACPSLNRRQKRMARANWWFGRMRQAVDQALDWAPAPQPRPEQIWFRE
jgi:hypothetical protein